MLYLFRLLFLLINIDQETVLNWFGIEDPTNPKIENDYDFNLTDFETSTDISLTTFRLLIEGLWDKIQEGLTLTDIENVLIVILFIRFIILAIRYNLKTSFYITCIGLFAGYLWYRHLIDVISMYRSVLLKLPFLHKIGIEAINVRHTQRQLALTDLKLGGNNAHWYNPGQVLYYGFTKGIVHVDPETGLRYYIDPISMIVSNLQEPIQSKVLPLYYEIYNKIIPKIYEVCSKFWNQFSTVAGYALITRIGKRYCPYLVRWHWTFLLIIGMVEQIFVFFIHRVYYFQSYIVVSQKQSIYSDPTIDLQVNILNALITCVVFAHIGFILFGLFHAIWGQYFYIPFFTENTELHIGPRPTNSVYSGGQTSWQNPEEKEKSLNRLFPKLWYGWFGRGTKSNWSFVSGIGKLFKKIWKKLKRQLKG